MFECIPLLPSDPILGLMAQFNNDPRPEKIDLGVGIYRDETGATPVMSAVKLAEQRILDTEQTKAYVGPQGNQAFNTLLSSLILGDTRAQKLQSRTVVMQTPGGCGALRVAAELIKCTGKPTVWVSDPTWGNHIPLLEGAGLHLQTYPYYDGSTHTLCFDAMVDFLTRNAKKGDIILLHGCCHNPSGLDLSQTQWQVVADLCREQGFIPFVDMAYQGFGDNLESDAYGVRLLCDNLDEVLLAYSCSKNFGLYRERVGAVGLIASSEASKNAVSSQMQTIVRGMYSMPPSHGAMVVETILSDNILRQNWEDELSQKHRRIEQVRQRVCEQFDQQGFKDVAAHLLHAKGMFAFMGLDVEKVTKLARDYGIYMVDSSRFNVAGLTNQNIPYFVRSVCDLIDT